MKVLESTERIYLPSGLLFWGRHYEDYWKVVRYVLVPCRGGWSMFIAGGN